MKSSEVNSQIIRLCFGDILYRTIGYSRSYSSKRPLHRFLMLEDKNKRNCILHDRERC